MKSVTFKRIGAFFIDIMLITLITNLFVSFIPKSDKVKELNKEQKTIYDKYVKEEIDSDKYIKKSNDIGYQISKETLYVDIIANVVIIGYFIIYQYKNKGKTLGKQLMKIQIVKNDDSKLSVNDITIRSLLVNSLLVSIMSMIMIMFLPKNIYIEANNIIYLIQGMIILVSMLMINIRKDQRGIHDLITNTKVIAIEEEKQ